jgi:hypothetical protein
MAKVPVYKDFVHDALLARLLLLGTGSVDTKPDGKRFTLPGGARVVLSHQAETLDRMQLFSPEGGPLSVELSCTDAHHVAALMNNADIAIMRERPDLPLSFYELADAVGRRISGGYLDVREDLAALNAGTLGETFLAGLGHAAPDLQAEIDRVRSDTRHATLPRNPGGSSFIRWHGWAATLDNPLRGTDDTLSVDGFTWNKAATTLERAVLARRVADADLVPTEGKSVLLARSADAYFLENASGGLEMLAHFDGSEANPVIAVQSRWLDDTLRIEAFGSALAEWVSDNAPKP